MKYCLIVAIFLVLAVLYEVKFVSNFLGQFCQGAKIQSLISFSVILVFPILHQIGIENYIVAFKKAFY